MSAVNDSKRQSMSLVAIFLLFVLLLAERHAQAEAFETDVVETNNLRLLYFDPFQTYLLPHAIRNFENSLAFHRKMFDWEPHEEATVILTDIRDYGNAGARAIPYNSVEVYIAPPIRTLELIPSSEWIFTLMNHELVHVANIDVANRQDRRWRRFFGGKPHPTNEHPESILYSYLAAPRFSAPRWYFEGAAVFMETWMSGGLGRAQGAYDEMVFRAMVRDDAHFYSNLGISSEGVNVDFRAGANAYLYGTRFLSYLGLTYSPEQVVEWLKRGEGSERYYSKQYRKVFGKTLEEGWNDWIAWEHEFQQANLAAVREWPLTPTDPLTSSGLGWISRSFIDTKNQTMIGAFHYPGVVAHVGVLSLADGRVDRIVDIKGAMKYRVSSTAWDPDTRTFFYTADNTEYRDLMAVDVDTGESRMLLQDARIGDIVYSPADRSIWGLRHLNGFVSLVRVPYPYKEWNLVHSWEYGRVAYELDISRDGTRLSTSLGEVDGRQFLRVFETADLLDGKAEPISEFEFTPAAPEGFVFSDDGKYLYGSSFYTGVSNIFRYEIETGALEAVSNAETGFIRPVPLDDGRLMVFEYTGSGFIPTVIDPVPLEDLSAITFLGSEIAKRHPIVREWNVVGGLDKIDVDTVITHRGKYRPYRELRFDSAYPVIEGYRDFEAVGWHVDLRDPAQLHRVGLTASYSWDSDLQSSEKLHASVEYHALNWYAQYWHNDADFYDLAGPTERSRKGDAYIVGYKRALIFDAPRRLDLKAKLAYYTGLDTLPSNQNVATLAIDDILSLDIGLHYNNSRESLGAVDHEKGFDWDLMLSADRSEFDTVLKPVGGLDFGFALPWKHSSLWFYNSAGSSNGERADPLGNFYFGGFGNNYVDDGSVKRYREYSSFPGFEIDEISANEFVKTVAEWNLPPVRFRNVGSPGLYLRHARPAFFFGALVADPGEPFERTVTTAGFQVDFQFTLAHHLPMTFSLGYASGFENGDRRDDEWMVSLKIL